MKYLRTTIYPIHVQFEDIDFGGAVHNPNYLKYFERARNHGLHQSGYGHGELLKDNLALAVSEIRIKYLRPALIDQDLYILTRITRASRTALRVDQVILNQKPSVDLESTGDHLSKLAGVITTIQTKMVSVDIKIFRPVRFSEKLCKILELPESPEAGRDNVDISE